MKITKSTSQTMWGDHDFRELIREYADECATRGLPAPDPREETYTALEKLGMMHVWAAYYHGRMVGFINLYVTMIPHYSRLIGVSESFFVGRDWRLTGAGMKLLREAEHFAREQGALGLMLSAPVGSRLAEILPRTAYQKTNEVFFRSFA